jgi:hypothetical protein
MTERFIDWVRLDINSDVIPNHFSYFHSFLPFGESVRVQSLQVVLINLNKSELFSSVSTRSFPPSKVLCLFLVLGEIGVG